VSKFLPIAAFAAACCALGSAAEPLDASLSRSELQQRFDEWRAAGSVRIDARLEWAYLFASGDARALEALSLRLVADGYRIAALHSAPASSSELSVTRVEQHTPTSLARRNGELAALAQRYPGASYVGAEPKPGR
jgi:hypothetical protein